MPKTRLTIAHEIAADIHASELSLDAAIAQIGSLLVKMSDARMTARVGANINQAALQRAAAAISGIVTARADLVGVHDAASDAARSLNLDPRSMGAGFDKSQELMRLVHSAEAA